MSERKPSAATEGMDEETIIRYLRQHPQFLTEHPELLEVIAPPERELGDNVADFQQFQVKNLQSSTRSLQSKYNGLIDFCRDNLSVQGQVHAAVLRLIRARSLDQLLEALTVDLQTLFDLDVVRLAIESESAEMYDSYYSEDNYSGLVFIESGVTDLALVGKPVLLLPDTEQQDFIGFDQVFTDCERLVGSCAVLRLELEEVPRSALLAFGVRYRQRFHPGQATDLLVFLARIVAHQLDTYLKDADEMDEHA